jgi:hypothetical protein
VLEGVTAWWLTQKLDTCLMAPLSLPPPSSHSCLKSRSWVCVIDLTCYIVSMFFFKSKSGTVGVVFSCTFHSRWSLVYGKCSVHSHVYCTYTNTVQFQSKIPTPSSFHPLILTQRNTNPFMSFRILSRVKRKGRIRKMQIQLCPLPQETFSTEKVLLTFMFHGHTNLNEKKRRSYIVTLPSRSCLPHLLSSFRQPIKTHRSIH